MIFFIICALEIAIRAVWFGVSAFAGFRGFGASVRAAILFCDPVSVGITFLESVIIASISIFGTGSGFTSSGLSIAAIVAGIDSFFIISATYTCFSVFGAGPFDVTRSAVSARGIDAGPCIAVTAVIATAGSNFTI